MPTSQPNILFVFSDQQRPDTMGCYGQRLPVTPNLDALSREGVRFDAAFTCQPVCGPARAALQTGKWATQTGCFRNNIALPQSERTMAHYLSEAGYEVGYVGKWHLASQGEAQKYETIAVPPHLRGGYKDFWVASDVLEFTSHSYDGHMFDADGNRREFPPGRYRVEAETDILLECLQNRRKDRPFFAFVSYIEPHHQNDHRCFEGPAGSKERFKDYDVPGDLAGTGGDWQVSYPDYLGCCWSLDQNFARIREELVRQGEWEKTLVIYTSDHGCHFRTRNSEYKRSCHDNCLQIPLIIRGPGFSGGHAVKDLVSLLDLTPTVLTAAGVVPPAHMAGRALQGLDSGTVTDWRDAVYAEISEDHIGRCLRTSRWKYSVRVPSEKPMSGNRQPGSRVYHEECLYDLPVDPFERENLVRSPQHAPIRAELAERMKQAVAAAGEASPEILPAA
jgi:arylsulfatase A-like enzyme